MYKHLAGLSTINMCVGQGFNLHLCTSESNRIILTNTQLVVTATHNFNK